MQLRGVLTPIVTPFDRDGAIDWAALERLVDFQLDAGITGLIPGGSTGEFYALTPDERDALNRFVMERARGRCTLIAGANATSTADVIAYGRAAAEQGFDAIMLAPPYYSLPSQDDLLRHFEMVLDAVEVPLVLYNFPARAGVEIGYSVLDGLADHPRVVAIKESSGDIARLYGVRQRYAGRLQLVCGSDDQAFDYFAWGVEAWIAGGANPAPAGHVAVLSAALDGRWDDARAAMDRLMPLLQDMEAGKYNQKAKYGLELAGVPCGETRPPLMPLSAREKAAFAELFQLATA